VFLGIISVALPGRVEAQHPFERVDVGLGLAGKISNGFRNERLSIALAATVFGPLSVRSSFEYFLNQPHTFGQAAQGTLMATLELFNNAFVSPFVGAGTTVQRLWDNQRQAPGEVTSGTEAYFVTAFGAALCRGRVRPSVELRVVDLKRLPEDSSWRFHEAALHVGVRYSLR
jgi:hypothetical protein